MPEEIARHYHELLRNNVELVLVAGSIVLDPQDPYLSALEHVDARLIRRGAPIDPGTMFWVAYAGDVPFFGLASCEMYGKLSIFDLFLPYALAGEPITNELISQLGYGGLLNDTQIARWPSSWRTG
jgi:molybdopterin biosynthesis enzyme